MNNLKISCHKQYPYAPTSGLEELYVLIEIETTYEEKSKRTPVNLSVVLDRSGSMTGTPLHYCKEACKFLVNQLTGKDILSIVTFDDKVETVLKPQSALNKDLIKQKVDMISTRGMTNLSGGLIKGCQHVLNYNSQKYTNRVLILSDGVANVGVTDPLKLSQISNEYHLAGAVISTMGVSDNFDEDLLESIADYGKGNFHFIDKVEEIPNVFEQELDELLSVVAQNVTLKLTPEEGIIIDDIIGYTHQSEDGSITINLGDIYNNETKSILLKCSIPAKKEGIHDLFNLDLSYVDITDGVKDTNLNVNYPIEYTTDLLKISKDADEKVIKQLEISNTGKLIEKALRHFDNGEYQSGVSLLQKQVSHLEILAKESNDNELLEESQQLHEHIKDFSYSKQKRKELHREKYRQLKRRKKS